MMSHLGIITVQPACLRSSDSVEQDACLLPDRDKMMRFLAPYLAIQRASD